MGWFLSPFWPEGGQTREGPPLSAAALPAQVSEGGPQGSSPLQSCRPSLLAWPPPRAEVTSTPAHRDLLSLQSREEPGQKFSFSNQRFT